MAKQASPGLDWETLIRTLLERLEIPSRDELDQLKSRLDRLEKLLYQKPASHEAFMDSDPPVRTSTIASNVVLDIISRYAGGCDFKTIREQTGYNDKKLRNIIFRLDKLGKIKRIKRGIYKSAAPRDTP